MARDNDYTSSDATSEQTASNREDTSAGDDPLVELARIVNRNKPAGSTASDRVGSTDYFAGLDDFSDIGGRPAPHVDRPAPEAGAPVSTAGASSDSYGHGDLGGVVPSRGAPVEPADHGRAPQPEVTGFAEAPAEQPELRDEAPGYLDLKLTEDDLLSGAPGNGSVEALPEADLEDELIGAFRTSFDANRRQEPGDRYNSDLEPRESFIPVQPPAATDDFYSDQTVSSSLETPGESEQEYRRGLYAGELAAATAPEAAAEYDYGTDEGQTDEVDDIFAPETGSEISPEPVSERAPEPRPTPEWQQPTNSGQLGGQMRSDAPAQTAATDQTPEGIGNGFDDLFAELGQLQTNLSREKRSAFDRQPLPDEQPVADTDYEGGDADTLTRAGPVPSDDYDPLISDGSVQSHDAARSDDIDDMAWPAAASRIPARGEEEEAPPPAGGYDLEAVAQAMQESDPTIGRSGVLPPHSQAEADVEPRAPKKGRNKGLMTAAAVLGVVFVGGVGYALLAGNSGIQAPSGPPPVIAGLQGPLKVMPEPAAEGDDNSGSKLIYDRVEGNTDTSRERLILPEKTEPADLRPAPDTVVTTDPLVPGGPKRVRTLVVRPDGTIVSEAGNGQATRVIAPSPGSNQTQTPDATTQPAATVGTPPTFQPVNPAPETAAASETDTQTGDGVPGETAASETPVSAEDAANAPRMVPTPKPAVPVRVARATPQQSASPVSGPLVLGGDQPSAPAAPATPVASTPQVSASGSIPAGTYVVQVTSQRSSEAALQTYADLQRRYPQVLGNRQAAIVPAEIDGRGTFYRARIPSASRAEAISLCESLQAAGGDCFVRRN
ncbi:SPOR domain-containing protein [Roseibium sp. CAU 1637]|uniref:SPOR domain-containing protein n=1 Tax=Roseibium limicola TaxID=2816037 RepID=A0A939ERK5_9HYPH|nr:SPOR domain-containing protein [Roseibium limicola]MBO0346263.1 SPOR domain-containing protein [Roseibium limicola]